MSYIASRYMVSAQGQLASTGTGDVKTSTPPKGTIHVLLSAVTNDAWFTLDGSTPSSTNGHVLPKGALPLYLPIGWSAVLSVASTVAGTSTVNYTWINW